MNSFATGFLTGFMGDQAEKISKRKSDADDYFKAQMEMAQKTAMKNRAEVGQKMSGAEATAKQMMAIGVPQETVMAIINQNPDDLPQFYETVQKMKAKGVDTTNPDFYSSLIQVDGEFNPGQENVTSLLKKIYQPLTANIKADPEGFGFDPKGSLWATMFGYNAMERASQRLETTEALPGMSAADVLRNANGILPKPLGGGVVTINNEKMGNDLRAAAKSQRNGKGDLTINETKSLLDAYESMVAKERTTATAEGGVMDEDTARRAAAQKMLKTFGADVLLLPDISTHLSTEEPQTGPVAAPTAPAAPEATKVAPTPSAASSTPPSGAEPPSELPDGSKLAKTFPDGSVGYILPDGSKVKYTRAKLNSILRSTTTKRSTPTPGWLDRQGSEYDQR